MKIDLISGHVALADDADAELLRPYSWYLCRSGSGRLYVAARVRGSKVRVRMHRLLMNAPANMVVHHINNDGLDNRRANLEVTTNRKNLIYAYDGKEAGVHFHKQSGKWRAQLRGENGKFVSLGLHDTRESAVFAATTFREARS